MEIFFILFIGFMFWLVFAGNKAGAKAAADGRSRGSSNPQTLNQMEASSAWAAFTQNDVDAQVSSVNQAESSARQDMAARRAARDEIAPPTMWENNFRSNGNRRQSGSSAQLPVSTLSPKLRSRTIKAAKLASRMAETRVGKKLLVDDRNASRQTLSSKRVPQLFSGKNATAIIGLSGLGLYVLSQF